MCKLTMFSFILAVALLPAVFSAPLTTCDRLTEQLQIQGRNQFLGVWTYAAESTNLPGSKALTEMFVDNVWGKIYPANESDSFYVFQVQKMSGRCYSVTSKLTLINNILHMEEPIFATEVLLATSCPDCLVLLSNYTLGGSMYRGLQILTKRPKVTQDEMDEFERQAACLNLPSPTSLDSDKGFCTDDSASKDSETTDLTSVLSQTQPEYMKLLDKLLSSQSGMKTLVHLIANIPTQN